MVAACRLRPHRLVVYDDLGPIRRGRFYVQKRVRLETAFPLSGDRKDSRSKKHGHRDQKKKDRIVQRHVGIIRFFTVSFGDRAGYPEDY